MISLNTDSSLQDAPAAATARSDTLGQADFMRLMTEQLRHQDPLKPLSNSEFVGQLAQFSTVQGISELNDTVQSFSQQLTGDQVLRGASLVGHSVLVPSERIALGEDGSGSGIVMAPGAGTVTVEISDASGTVVRRIDIAVDAKGETAFSWDGLDEGGQRLPAGAYGVAARHSDTAGNTAALNTYVDSRVESVTIGSDGLYLNLPLLGAAPLDYVLRIGGTSS